MSWLFEEASDEVKAMADVAMLESRLDENDVSYARHVRNTFKGGLKFVGADLGSSYGASLYDAACNYLKTDEAKRHALPFVADIARKYARGGGLTDGQAAGILNCMTAQRPQRQDSREIARLHRHIDATVERTWVPDDSREKRPAWSLDDDDKSYDAWLCQAASSVGQGYYTVVLADRRVTIRLGKWQDDKRRPGEIMRWVSYLNGSDNESDYAVFAIQQGDGNHRVMPAFRASHGHLNTALNVLLQGGGTDAALEYALESKRCARCNRLLTVPASVYAGYGPECVKHVGG